MNAHPSVTVYSSPFCPYCYMAKKLLKKKGVAFDEIDLCANPERRPEMLARASGRSSAARR